MNLGTIQCLQDNFGMIEKREEENDNRNGKRRSG